MMMMMMTTTVQLLGALGVLGVAWGLQEDQCAVAVVGGGWAGVYAAYRLVVDSKAFAASSVCLFEGGARTGGRTYSVAFGGLTIDVGAYRFSREQHLPGDLILKKLKMKTACYEPTCAPDGEFNETLYKIVNAGSNNVGYGRPIEVMTEALVAAGARVAYGHELVKLEKEGEEEEERGVLLTFKNGRTVAAARAILNLPRLRIGALDAPPLFADAKTAALLTCEPCPTPDLRRSMDLKVYAVYQNPWWVTKLGLTDGLFTEVASAPPFVGRYHDGPVLKQNGLVVGPGALEVVYTFSAQYKAVRWYDAFRAFYDAFLSGDANKRDAGSITVDDHDDPQHRDPLTVSYDAALLGPIHDKLMRMHASNFSAADLNASEILGPTARCLGDQPDDIIGSQAAVVMGYWDNEPASLTPEPLSANMAAQFGTDVCPAETCLAGVTPHEYFQRTVDPTAGASRVFITNNDYYYTTYQATPCCWAQQSLKTAERILHDHFALPKPDWLDEAYYEATVLQL